MKRFIKRLLMALLEIEFFWRLFVGLMARVSHLPVVRTYFPSVLHQKHIESRNWITQIVRNMTPDLKVIGGPFAGVVYPEADAYGSSFAPKLLGLYERELLPVLEDLPHHDVVYNIGCAEGYYSVGLLKSGWVDIAHCFDASPEALAMCREMAAANAVADRVRLHGICKRADLLVIDHDLRALILCDCEGCERALFDEAVARHLENANFIIEVHEHLGASLAALEAAFVHTHDLTRVASISEWQRAAKGASVHLDQHPLGTRLLLAAELRADMHWLVARARTQTGATAAARRGP